jgi:hypothetical protein
MPPSRMSDKELKQFVLGCCDGKVYTNRHINSPDVVPLVFMSLAFWNKPDFEDVGLIWEWLSEAGPRAVNGHPTFMSCRLMHAADWERARVAIERELKRREEIEV